MSSPREAPMAVAQSISSLRLKRRFRSLAKARQLPQGIGGTAKKAQIYFLHSKGLNQISCEPAVHAVLRLKFS